MEKRVAGSGVDLIHLLPENLLQDILSKLDAESLCSVAPVCRSLRSFSSQALNSIPVLDLSEFSPTDRILTRVVRDNWTVTSLTLDCSRLDDFSVEVFAKGQLQELVLLKCRFSSYVFRAIGEKCPNLRLLTVEMACPVVVEPLCTFEKSLTRMLERCLSLEFLCIKFQPAYADVVDYGNVQILLPKTIRSLLLQPILNWQANLLIRGIGAGRNSDGSSANVSRLQSLSLVLKIITDDFLICITDNLPHLTELCLEDKPLQEPLPPYDLTNNGLQSIGSYGSLTHLSLTRSKEIYPATFKRVNDVGMFLLAERCEGLEYVRFGGFSKVSDAGYRSILHSCKKLRRYEIVNAFSLSDLAFHGLSDAANSLVEVRLVSCDLLTSETVVSLSSCRGLEVLDLSGCKSIADAALYSIPELSRLTMLDLGGADITDSGLSALGGASSPIASLCLRRCRRITDRGIVMLLHGSGTINKTLLTLDLGGLPGVSDRAIAAISGTCRKLSCLCVRFCFFITVYSMKALSSMVVSGSRSLRRLDIYHCSGLSVESLRFLDLPLFSGLRWLGVGRTRLASQGKERLIEVSTQRPGLSMCFSGCEMGCKDGWDYHEDF